jgi:hypothetical protein
VAPTHFQTANYFQSNALAAVEESLGSEQRQERLSTLVRWDSPLVRARYLKESFQLFRTYKQPWRAAASAQVDELGHAIEAGAMQEIRGYASTHLDGSSPGPKPGFRTKLFKV